MNEDTSQPANSVQRKSNWWILIFVFAGVIALYAVGISLQYKLEQERYDQFKLKLDKQQAEENKLLGEKLDTYALPIIQAIEQYKNDKGSYPENLTVLVPAYLEQEPYAAFGEKLKYSPKPPQQFHSPFYFAFYGHYPFPAFMHGRTYMYCPEPACDISRFIGAGVYRINQNWIYLHSSAL
jgi:hypothetical protein